MLFQKYDGELPSLAFRISSLGKYLDLRTLATWEFGFWRICHYCFASIALLKVCKFLKPMPPQVFCLHIVFQLIKHILVSCCLWPHQKFLIMLSISSHKLWGRRKQPIVYVGIACAIAFMRISFPPIERSFPFQSTSFCPILSFMIENTCFFNLPMKDGRPRYLVCLESCIRPRVAKISSLDSCAILGLKKIEDLSMLIF